MHTVKSSDELIIVFSPKQEKKIYFSLFLAKARTTTQIFALYLAQSKNNDTHIFIVFSQKQD